MTILFSYFKDADGFQKVYSRKRSGRKQTGPDMGKRPQMSNKYEVLSPKPDNESLGTPPEHPPQHVVKAVMS